MLFVKSLKSLKYLKSSKSFKIFHNHSKSFKMEKSTMTQPALRTVKDNQDCLAVKNLKYVYLR